MSTRKSNIKLAGLEIQTVRKNIKNIHIGVYPPNGRIRVAAPEFTTDDKIRLIVISKIPWIKKQQDKFISQKREAPREYVAGESHYFRGQRYLLKIIEKNAPCKVQIEGRKNMLLFVEPGTDAQGRRRVLEDFYRRELKKTLDTVVPNIEKLLGVKASEIKIKRMKTKWGSANIQEKRIWFNLELAKKSQNCLNYVVLHELTHLIERKHNEHFRDIVSSAMPNWKMYREELNEFISGDKEWICDV